MASDARTGEGRPPVDGSKGVAVGETLPHTLISASDIERYAYCPLSWWLKKGGIKGHTEGTVRGERIHSRMGRDIQRIKAEEEEMDRYETAMWVFVLVAVLLALTTMSVFFSTFMEEAQGEISSLMLLAVATLWMGASVIFLALTLRERQHRLARPTPAAGAPGSGKALAAVEGTHAKGGAPGDRKVRKEARVNAILFILVAVMLAMLGLGSNIPLERDLLSRMMAVSALLWLLGTSTLFYIVLRRLTSREAVIERTHRATTRRGAWDLSGDEKLLAGFAIVASVLAVNAFWIRLGPSADASRILFVLAFAWLAVGIYYFYHSLREGILGTRSLAILEEELREDAEAGRPAPKGGKGEPKRRSILDGSVLRDIEENLTTSEKVTLNFTAVALIMVGMALVIHYQPYEQMGPILVVVTLAWLIGSSAFLFAQLSSRRIARKLRESHAVARGRVEYSDTPRTGPRLLRSDVHNISGRPDYIIEEDGDYIPVEIKTGAVPKGPYFSHVLQVATYCILVEEEYGTRPPFGLVQYGNVTKYKVDFTDELKVLLISKLQAMRECVKVGEAHRNHNRPGKCTHCSRRRECPERLDRPGGGEAGDGPAGGAGGSRRGGRRRGRGNRRRRGNRRPRNKGGGRPEAGGEDRSAPGLPDTGQEGGGE